MTKTILVVDDLMAERIRSKQMLEKAGYRVIEAVDGAEALELAKQHLPHAVVMDIVMPTMDGFTATAHLRRFAETSSIPVIMLSSKNQESDIFRAKRLGVFGYLTKPASRDQLLEILATI